ncbi:MAG: hypothetical protein KA282_00080 [Clostridia bacterium]|nr:hypothetical protein [Clostridia bacterium]
MKKPHGHYCRICGQRKANEKFSGRGHAVHICMACAKRGNKPPEITTEVSFVNEDEPAILFEEASSKPKRRRRPSKEKLLRSAQKKQAKGLLSRLLSDGEKSVAEIQKTASDAHIPMEALRRAKASLGIRSYATENGSVWRLPKIGTSKPDSPTTTD